MLLSIGVIGAESMLGFFRRRRQDPPAVEWGNGKVRALNVLDALEHSTDAVISRYRHGLLESTRDESEKLHLFTCDCVQAVLDDVVVDRIPVYIGTPTDAHDVWSAAASLAKNPRGRNDSTRRIHCEFPTSFRAGLEVKRRWLAGAASIAEVREVIERVAAQTQLNWPSNFCLSVNSIQIAGWCVLSALNLDEPGLGAHGSAQCAARFKAYRRACEAMRCRTIEPDLDSLVWEGAQLGDRFEGRGVGCPQAIDKRAEALAIKSIQETFSKWWEDLGDSLARRLAT